MDLFPESAKKLFVLPKYLEEKFPACTQKPIGIKDLIAKYSAEAIQANAKKLIETEEKNEDPTKFLATLSFEEYLVLWMYYCGDIIIARPSHFLSKTLLHDSLNMQWFAFELLYKNSPKYHDSSNLSSKNTALLRYAMWLNIFNESPARFDPYEIHKKPNEHNVIINKKGALLHKKTVKMFDAHPSNNGQYINNNLANKEYILSRTTTFDLNQSLAKNKPINYMFSFGLQYNGPYSNVIDTNAKFSDAIARYLSDDNIETLLPKDKIHAFETRIGEKLVLLKYNFQDLFDEINAIIRFSHCVAARMSPSFPFLLDYRFYETSNDIRELFLNKRIQQKIDVSRELRKMLSANTTTNLDDCKKLVESQLLQEVPANAGRDYYVDNHIVIEGNVLAIRQEHVGDSILTLYSAYQEMKAADLADDALRMKWCITHILTCDTGLHRLIFEVLWAIIVMKRMGYVHTDLHAGNVCVRLQYTNNIIYDRDAEKLDPNDYSLFSAPNGKKYYVRHAGYNAALIDFGYMSRVVDAPIRAYESSKVNSRQTDGSDQRIADYVKLQKSRYIDPTKYVDNKSLTTESCAAILDFMSFLSDLSRTISRTQKMGKKILTTQLAFVNAIGNQILQNWSKIVDPQDILDMLTPLYKTSASLPKDARVFEHFSIDTAQNKHIACTSDGFLLSRICFMPEYSLSESLDDMIDSIAIEYEGGIQHVARYNCYFTRMITRPVRRSLLYNIIEHRKMYTKMHENYIAERQKLLKV